MERQIEKAAKEQGEERRGISTVLGGMGVLLTSCGLAFPLSVREFGSVDFYFFLRKVSQNDRKEKFTILF